jgi:uncharacterized protein YlxW (UPF0749 family)
MNIDLTPLLDYGAIGFMSAILIVAVVFLWRELDKAKKAGDLRYNQLSEQYFQLQAKYEALLIEVGQLRGRVDEEIKIDQKINKILERLEKPS